MSYTQHLPTQYITVHYSGSVSYPASQNGGTVSYSGTVQEPVDVVVHVDTERFDAEVDHCNDSVNLLTGSVAATEAAQVASVRANSRKIGETLISGFHHYVGYEISQQIAELRNKIDALLLNLRKFSERCLNKRDQMQSDYNRTCARYLKIFSELDQELENRIHSIDAPVFDFSQSADTISQDSDLQGMVAVSSVSASENSRLHAMISASIAKKRAKEAIAKAEEFLSVQYAADRVLADSLRPGEAAIEYMPCCLVETEVGPQQHSAQIYSAPMLSRIPAGTLSNEMNEFPWQSAVTADSAQRIGAYYNEEVAAMTAGAGDEHSRRVAAMTARLFDLSSTAAPGF